LTGIDGLLTAYGGSRARCGAPVYADSVARGETRSPAALVALARQHSQPT
jgi:hypothetical protein